MFDKENAKRTAVHDAQVCRMIESILVRCLLWRNGSLC
jgi:hypothetical protein